MRTLLTLSRMLLLPLPAGTPEQVDLLTIPWENFFVGIRARDEAGNLSEVGTLPVSVALAVRSWRLYR
jgi:hypothetical protein